MTYGTDPARDKLDDSDSSGCIEKIHMDKVSVESQRQ